MIAADRCTAGLGVSFQLAVSFLLFSAPFCGRFPLPFGALGLKAQRGTGHQDCSGRSVGFFFTWMMGAIAVRSWPWILVFLVVSCAGRDPYKKVAPDDRAFIEAVDVFMEPEEIEAWLEAEDALSRNSLSKSFGMSEKYEGLSEAERQAIAEGAVLEGMSKDAVFMSLGLPTRIRKQFEGEIEEYVESYQYRYERTRRGDVFLSPPNSRSAYKNEVFERHVEFVGGVVRAVKEVDVN